MKKQFGTVGRFGLGLLVLAASACDDPLSEVEAIDKTRVVGARIEVAGDPTRAAPLPGEDVVVRFLVLAPDPEPAFAYALTACVAAFAVMMICTSSLRAQSVDVPNVWSHGTRLAVSTGAPAANDRG